MTLTLIETDSELAPVSRTQRSAAPLGREDEAELARRALTNAPDVWAELVARYEPSIRVQLARTLAAGADVLCSDSVDEALGEYWIALLRNDRAWLRRFDASRGYALSTWLTALAWDVATKHLRKLRRWRAGLPMEEIDLDLESFNPRGMRFLAFMQTIQPDTVTKPFFKWR
jgi:hypothetical protein